MDYHNHSLALLDAIQAKDDADIITEATTYLVGTTEWQRWCLSIDEANEMTKTAINEGLAFRIETCPF